MTSSLATKERILPLRDYQLDVIARLACLANSPEVIAETIGIPLKRITSLMTGSNGNKKFKVLQAKYEKIMAENFHGASMKMIEMIPACHEAQEAALGSDDKRLAVDTAFRVMDAVGLTGKTQPGGAEEPRGGDTYNFINSQANTVLTTTMDKVAETLTELREFTATEIPKSHEFLGTEAIPVPAGQLEVTDGEALTPIEEAKEVLEIITTEVVE